LANAITFLFSCRFIFVGTSSWGTDLDVIRGLDSAENAITFSFDTSKLGFYFAPIKFSTF
jgi:hypothetical protein